MKRFAIRAIASVAVSSAAYASLGLPVGEIEAAIVDPERLLEPHVHSVVAYLDGEPVGAINRIPAKDQVRSNLAKGGRAEAVELTPRDKELCATIGPELRKRGLLFVGIDVIGDYLTGINVTSPTGAQQLKRFGGADAASLLWDRVEAIRQAA